MKCRNCEVNKDETLFYKGDKVCKQCRIVNAKARYAENPELAKERARLWAERHREKSRAAQAAYHRKHYVSVRKPKAKRERPPEYVKAQRMAHFLVTKALASGKLSASAHCSKCGSRQSSVNRIHAHHADYSRPLDIEWLCQPCHAARHSEMRKSGISALPRPPLL